MATRKPTQLQIPAYADGDTIIGDGTFVNPIRAPGGGGGGGGTFANMNLSTLLVPAALPFGVTNNWNPGAGWDTASAIAVETHALGSTVTGIVPTAAGDVRFMMLSGSGNGPWTIAHMSALSSADNRIYCPDEVDAVVPQGGAAILYGFGPGTGIHGWRFMGIASTRYHRMDVQRFSLGAALTPAAIGASENNYNPAGFSSYSRVRVQVPPTGGALTGMAAGIDGEIKVIENLGDLVNTPGATLTLKSYDFNSAAANRFYLPGIVDVVLPVAGVATMVYDLGLQLWMLAGKGA